MPNSPARTAVDVGSVIADTYKIEALLGRGGMGAVFLASHKRLAGKQVAIKILHTEIEDTDIVARFKREAEIAAKLNHPNIVGVIDYNVAPDGMPYLVLDYLEGETLAHRIARGPMPLDHVLSIVRQVGSALAAAHRAGIVHRDLKPQNIFLVPTVVDGHEVEIAKVLDFGISKIRGSQTVKTQESTLLGTPQYMAPEQALGQHDHVDERTDVFAFGAIVYEMLCGSSAFSGASIPEVVFKVVYEQPAPLAPLAPSVPPAIVSAVMQAMAKPAEDRFPSIAGFVEAITGQPLSVTRGQSLAPAPAAESPSAARRVATREALAQTMGRGDYDSSETHPLVATLSPPTVDAVTPSTPRAPASPAAPTVDLHARPTSGPPEPRRRSTGTIAAIVIAGAAVAAGAMYLVMRNHAPTGQSTAQGARPEDRSDRGVATTEPTRAAAGDPAGTRPADTRPADTRPADTRPADTRPTDTRPADTRPVDTKPADVIADVPSAPKPAAGKPDPKQDPRAHSKPDPKPATAPPAPAPDGDADGNADARDKLTQATAALTQGKHELAEQLASAVINAPASAKQHATARLIHGTVQCVAHNDQEAAQIDLRNLEGSRGLRLQLLSVCKRHGINLSAQ
jgi:serine/threonine protein kinase